MARSSDPPRVLTVVMVDDLPTVIAIIHEGEWRPYGRRTVQIELTEGQRRQLTPRNCGQSNGKPSYETILQCWFEPREEGEDDGQD